MTSIRRIEPELSRQRLVNPHIGTSYHEQLRKGHAVDLRDNVRIEHLENGYARAVALDPARLWEA